MKATIKIEKGQTTKAYINRITADYLKKHERLVPIEEVRQFFLAQGNTTVKNVTKSAFEKMVEKQIMAHAMKYM